MRCYVTQWIAFFLNSNVSQCCSRSIYTLGFWLLVKVSHETFTDDKRHLFEKTKLLLEDTSYIFTHNCWAFIADLKIHFEKRRRKNCLRLFPINLKQNFLLLVKKYSILKKPAQNYFIEKRKNIIFRLVKRRLVAINVSTRENV
jgi:hypothetical protein